MKFESFSPIEQKIIDYRTFQAKPINILYEIIRNLIYLQTKEESQQSQQDLILTRILIYIDAISLISEKTERNWLKSLNHFLSKVIVKHLEDSKMEIESARFNFLAKLVKLIIQFIKDKRSTKDAMDFIIYFFRKENQEKNNNNFSQYIRLLFNKEQNQNYSENSQQIKEEKINEIQSSNGIVQKILNDLNYLRYLDDQQIKYFIYRELDFIASHFDYFLYYDVYHKNNMEHIVKMNSLVQFVPEKEFDFYNCFNNLLIQFSMSQEMGMKDFVEWVQELDQYTDQEIRKYQILKLENYYLIFKLFFASEVLFEQTNYISLQYLTNESIKQYQKVIGNSKLFSIYDNVLLNLFYQLGYGIKRQQIDSGEYIRQFKGNEIQGMKINLLKKILFEENEIY